MSSFSASSSESHSLTYAKKANRPATATPAKLATFASAPLVATGEAALPDAEPDVVPDTVPATVPVDDAFVVPLTVTVPVVTVADPVRTTVVAVTDPDPVTVVVNVAEPGTAVDTRVVAETVTVVPLPAWRENCSDWARMPLLLGWVETRLTW